MSSEFKGFKGKRNIDKALKMCLRKKKYNTPEMAEKVAKKVKNQRGVILRQYFCPVCQRHHLTKKNPKKS